MADFEKLEWTLAEAENGNFSNYSKLGETRNLSRENDAFAYPGPFTRNIAGTTNPRLSPKITRGFMRSIIMDQNIAGAFKTKSPGNLRLNFQFNPEYIERNVQQSPGAVNPLLQNPANLTQAVPGTAQFDFTMMFNREAEVAQRRRDLVLSGNVTSQIPSNTPIYGQGFDIDGGLASSAMTDPGQVGVMHDLSIFDSIIGQGITPELVNVITSYTRQQVVATTNDPNRSEDTEVPIFDDSKFQTSIENNFGNSAFLNPMPVRIVFSDLFMVEGLVVGSAVAFQKFSQDMIPTLCQVNCKIYALYVGFAKKKAFLTDNLTSWATDTVKADEAAAAEVAKETKAAINSLVTLHLAVNVSDGDKLTVPTHDTIAMKIFTPASTGKFIESASYYSGNGNVGATSWVTLPQYFNAFAYGAGRMRNTADTQFVGGNVLGGFTNSTLPISLYLETTDKEFNNVSSSFTASIIDAATGQTKNTVSSKNDGNWVAVRHGEMGFSAENTKKVPTTYMFKNTFYIDPVDVTSVKQTINNNSKCELKIGIKFNKTLSNGTLATHSIEQSFNYNGTDPFFYEVDLGNSGSNALLVTKHKVNLKRAGGGGGGNRR
jgi:hypothetical protein